MCHKRVEPHDGYISDQRDTLTSKFYLVHTTCLGKEPEAVPPSFADVTADKVEPSLSELEKVAQELLGKTADKFLELVPRMVAEEVTRLSPRELIVKVGAAPKVTIKRHHKILPDLIIAMAAGDSPFLVGPAGSGKTTIGDQLAQAFKLKFYQSSQITSEYKLLGFIDAKGQYVRTQFRDAYEKGGVFLFDEADASSPQVFVVINSALANGWCDFPDKMVHMHKDFKCVSAGNTYGRGADRQYVGRNQLDAATLDRFSIYECDYDEELELELAGNAEWTMYVQKVRKAVEAEKVRHIVSPRASIIGAKLLAAGMDRAKVEDARIWKGLDKAQRDRIIARMGVL